jgi:biotin carboxylase
VADKRLLVLGAGPAQLGLLAAARRLGLLVVVADRDPSAPGFRYADRRAIVSVEDEQALERLARAERVDGVIAPGSDRPLAIAARIAQKLGVVHPLSSETANAASARQRERERLAAAGVPQAEAVLCRTLDEIEAAADAIGYPCLISAADRQGQRGLAADAYGLPGAVAEALGDSRNDFCLVEQPAAGPEVTVNGYVLEGKLWPLTVTDAAGEPPAALDVPAVDAWPAAVPPEAFDAVAAAAAALGVAAGPVTARVALGEDGPRIDRLAPRLGGGHDAELCRVALGVDLNALAARAALGEPVAAEELEPRRPAGGACVRFLLAPPGELRAVTGLEDAYELDGILGIRVYRRPGHVFREVRKPADRAGAVLAVGADRDEALDRASRALELIRFETVDAAALV